MGSNKMNCAKWGMWVGVTAFLAYSTSAWAQQNQTPSLENDALRYNLRGASASQRDNNTGALRLHEKALKARMAADDMAGAVLELYNIAVDTARLGNMQGAGARLDEAVRLYEEEAGMGLGRHMEKRMRQAMARVSMFKAIMLMDDPGAQKSAADWADVAMEHCEKSMCGQRGAILNVQGRVAMTGGDPKKAAALAQKAITENRKNKNKLEISNSTRLLAEVDEAQGNHEGAHGKYLSALKMDRELMLGPKIAMDLLGLARTSSQLGVMEKALLFAKRALLVATASDYPAGVKGATGLLEKLAAKPADSIP